MAKIKNFKVDKKKMEASFVLEDTKIEFANTLRRVMITEVPTLAIEFVVYTKNDSNMPEEFLSHRIGLVPIKTDLKKIDPLGKYNLSLEDFEKALNNDDLSEIPSSTYIKFKLYKKGPCTVYSQDLIPENSKKMVPAIENIPLVKLYNDEELELEAYAVLGKGKDHIKWSPVTYCYYDQISDKSFNFCFGYDGSLEPKEILTTALNIIKTYLLDLENRL